MNHLSKLNAAFAALAKEGVLCFHNLLCCGGCAGTAIAMNYEGTPEEEKSRIVGAVFYHEQDVESVLEGHGLYLRYDALPTDDYGSERQRQIGKGLVAALKEAGLRPEWDGDPVKCVVIPHFQVDSMPRNKKRI